MIIDHNHLAYKARWMQSGENQYNGAYYYSKEIVEKMIPRVQTDRNWVTINIPGVGASHSIIFIHNNLHPENYNWLSCYKDLVLVCGIPETCDKVRHLGTPIYLPLSVDVSYVEKFRREKTKDTAFAGRIVKSFLNSNLPGDVEIIGGVPRDELLARMAEYRHIYAVGRTAIEARILGCDILPYDDRFPDPSIWKVVDTLEAADILQKELDRIERSKR